MAAHSSNPDRDIDRALGGVLYREVGWSQGLLLEKIAYLALAARFAEKRVTIITTNYDTYIEQEILRHLREVGKFAKRLEAEADPPLHWSVPGLKIKAFRRPGSHGRRTIERTVLQGYNTSDVIELVYIHGRIAESHNEGSSHIVLTERDYANSHARTVSTLLETLHRGSGLLVIGSSLRDKPLAEALVRSKSESKFALIKMGTWLEGKGLQLKNGPDGLTRELATIILRRRGKGLGDLTLIGTENHEQISQFVEELRLALEARAYEGLQWPVADLSYGQRLESWYENWAMERQSPEAEYQVVSDFLQAHRGGAGWFETDTRIEVWGREANPLKTRRLTVVCCSSGPLMSTYVPRSCDLADQSVAAARAFNEGRPLILSLEDLGLRSDASRWQRFLAVPIFAGFNLKRGAGYYGAAPVGAVVVAAARAKPRFESLDTAEKSDLIHHLVDLGLSILRGDDADGD